MNPLDALRPIAVVEVADRLELHPFEVVRMLALDDALPADLTLRRADVERLRHAGGFERWWDGPVPTEPGEVPARVLVRALATRLLEREVFEPRATRSDNLFRGLPTDQQAILRRAVNLLIREGYLASRMSGVGLVITVRSAHVADLRDLVAHGAGPLVYAVERV